ncbi:hypothetical protein SAMN03159496_04419 [Rhizobium sp. NFR07]|nr:hypothetical protein SAMN03159496_04419 [Rhizobium sp. NFR07]
MRRKLWKKEMAMQTWTTFDLSGVEPEEGAPAEDRLISGNPTFRSWNVEEAEGGIYAGIWEATPGKWRIVYDEWEYFHVLSGRSIVTEDGGDARELVAGDRMILRPGFRGTWEVLETTRKDYVIRLPIG